MCLQWRIIMPDIKRELFWNSQPLSTNPAARNTALPLRTINTQRLLFLLVVCCSKDRLKKIQRADSPEAKCLTTSLWHWFQCPALNKKRASLCLSPSILARTAFASWIHSGGMQSLCVRKVSLAQDSGVSERTQCRFRSSRTAFSRMLGEGRTRCYSSKQSFVSLHQKIQFNTSSRGLNKAAESCVIPIGASRGVTDGKSQPCQALNSLTAGY